MGVVDSAAASEPQPFRQVEAGDITGEAAQPVTDLISWFGERSVPVVLFSTGIAFTALAVSLRENNALTWTLPMFLSLLGFGSLLVMVGCLERVVAIRAHRALPSTRQKSVFHVLLNKLQCQALELAATTPPVEPSAADPTSEARGSASFEIEADVQMILALATTSPRTALEYLTDIIDRSMQKKLSPHLNCIREHSYQDRVRLIESVTGIQPGTLAAIRNFSNVQEELLHRQNDVNDSDMVHVIDSGIVILRSVAKVAPP